MDKKVAETTDLYHLIAWAHARRKQLIMISSAVVAVIAVIAIIVWHGNYQEAQAGEALSLLKFPPAASNAQPFLQLANENPKASAAARAILVAAGMLFEEGKYVEARAQFERFIREHVDYPLVNQAALGVAACYDAEGNVTEATSRYNDWIRRHPAEPGSSQARCALASLHIKQNKPELALRLYEDLMRGGNSDSWAAEARSRGEELLAKNPELAKQLTQTPVGAPPGKP